MAQDPLSPRGSHVNATLSTFASKYENSQFIADMLSPTVLVDKESNSFQKRSRVDSATIFDDAAGPRSPLQEVRYAIDDDTYLCRPRGLKGVVSQALQQNADAPLDPKEIATQTVMQAIKLARELRVATKIMTSGNWASANTSNASNWTSAVNGTPLADMQGGLESIPFNGDDVRVLGCCSDVVFHYLSRHPDFLSLRANGGSENGTVTPSELAKYVGFDDLLVSKIHYNTAVLNQTASYSRMWGSTTFAFVVVPKVMMSTEQTVFMPTFRFNADGSSDGILVREWHDPNVGTDGADTIAVSLKDDEKIVQNDAGHLFTGVTS